MPRAAAPLALAAALAAASCAISTHPAARSDDRALCFAAAASSAGSAPARGAEGNERDERPATLVTRGEALAARAPREGDPGLFLHAAACARLALALEPGYAPALRLVALAKLNDHRFAEARDLLTDALRRDPFDLVALGALSDASLELGDVAGAVDAAERMMAAKPSLPSYARASYLRWLHGDLPGALAAARRAIDAGRGQRDNTPVAWVITETAHLFLAGGDVDGAGAGYARALAVAPGYAPAVLGAGKVQLAQGRPDDAAAVLADALARQPSVEAAWWLAEARAAQGDDAGAAAAWAEARRIGRLDDPRALALLLLTRGEDTATAASLAAREATTRGDLYTDDVLALAALRTGDLGEAQRRIDRALRLGTPDPRLFVHRAAIRCAAGAPDARLIADAARARAAHLDRSTLRLLDEECAG